MSKKPASMSESVVSDLSKDFPGVISIPDIDGGVMLKIKGVISTRSAVLDHAIGRGGVPLGRMTVITGVESGGKTTLALHLSAEVQAMGGVALYIDREHKLDVDYARSLGVDMKRLIVSQPHHIEDCISLMSKAVERIKAINPGTPILIILDSIDASISKAEFEGDYEDRYVGARARAFSQMLPKLIHEISDQPVALVFISQIRESIGFNGSKRNLVSGGNATKYYPSLVIELIRISMLKEHEKPVGSIIKGKIWKNQIATPFKECDMHIRWGEGFDRNKALLDRAAQLGLVDKSESGWYEVFWPVGSKEKLKWQGSRKLEKIAAENPGLIEWLEKKTREQYE